MGRRTVLLSIALFAALSALYLWRGDRPGRAAPRKAQEIDAPVAARAAEEESAGEAAEERVVFGKVVRASDGAPVADADVQLIPLWREGKTDGQGRFELDAIDDQMVRCLAKAPGFRGALGPWLLVEGDRVDAGTIRLAAGPAILGRVVDADGRAVHGAWLSIEREGELSEEWEAVLGPFGTQEADANGRFAFDGLDDAPYRISVSVDEDFQRTVEHVRAGGDELLIALPFARTMVQGPIAVLVTLPDGRPLPRGDLLAGATESSGSESIVDGRARVEVEGAGPAWFAVLYPRDESDVPLPYRLAFRADAAPREEPYPVVLEPGETIEGTVVTTDEAPLRAAVKIGPRRLDVNDGIRQVAQVDDRVESLPDGRFRCVGLTPGEYGLSASCPGFAPVRRFVYARTGASDVRIEMRRAGRIRLRCVAPDGEALAGGTFRLFDATGASAWSTVSVGRNSRTSLLEHEFGGLHAGTSYRIEGTVGFYAPFAIDVVAGDGEPTEVRLQEGRAWRGRVVRGDGTAVVNALIRLRSPVPVGEENDFGRGPLTNSGQDGWFELAGAHDGAWVTCSAPGLVQEAPLAIRPEDREVEIRLVPAREISGRIVGDGPLDFRIDWTPVDLAGEALSIPREFQFSGTDGFFALRDLPPGAMRLDGWRPWIETDDCYVQAEAVAAGASDVRLTVRQGNPIEGVVRDRDGRGLPGIRVFVEAPARWTTSDEDGRFVLRALPRGRHAVRATGLTQPVLADAPGPPIVLVR